MRRSEKGKQIKKRKSDRKSISWRIVFPDSCVLFLFGIESSKFILCFKIL